MDIFNHVSICPCCEVPLAVLDPAVAKGGGGGGYREAQRERLGRVGVGCTIQAESKPVVFWFRQGILDLKSQTLISSTFL